VTNHHARSIAVRGTTVAACVPWALPVKHGRTDAEKPKIALVGYPVVHFEINSSGASELVRFYADAFGWTIQQDGHDYADIRTEGVCAGSGEPGIDGGIGTAEPGDDFVTIYVQVPDVQEALEKVLALGGNVRCE
jgi:predicted enzyme related to lactoylglutathione lyase